MYPAANKADPNLDKQVEGLDPTIGQDIPDHLLSDEIDGQIPPNGDNPTPEANASTDSPSGDSNVLPDDVSAALKEMVDNFDRVEQPVRDRMVRFWKKCELFFKGVQDIYWDYSAKDYRRTSSQDNTDQTDPDKLDFYYQDKIINIFRAHAESVIAALSQDVPTVIFPPDDAENQDDVQTAKGYTNAAELLQRANDADMLMMYAIFIMWNQGVVGAYNYNTTDFEFGSHLEPVYKDVTNEEKTFSCPECGGPVPNATEGQPSMCEYCGMEVMPEVASSEVVTTQEVSHHEEVPKRRERIEFYGPLSFRLPHYISNPKHTPYVMLDTECHVDYARDLFPNLDITEENDSEKYDRWARTSSDYQGEFTQGLVTLRRVWLRPWTYNRFKKNNTEVYDFLRQKFPSGAKVTFVNDKVAVVEDEDMDDHWTFTQSPLSTHIHAEPLGAPLLPIQEMRNELVVLKLQTVEFGIPETFADPSVLDFNAYKNHAQSPGMIYPAKALPGQNLDSGFTTLKTAVYPKEANDFQASLDADGQFTTGAFPSIYGGSMPSSSKTAAEYQQSKSQALQRLQTTWKVISKFWAKVMNKSVKSFIASMTRDEKFAQKKGHSYINVYIRQSELTGRVGSCEPEVAQTFPMSWMQKRDLLMQLLQMSNEFINQALFSPENTGLLSEYLGFKDFYIPGDDDRTKQLIEIQKMLVEEPIENSGEPSGNQLPPMQDPNSSGMGQQNPDNGGEALMSPTIPVDPEMDNHQVEYEVCVTWMKSEIGLDAKESNPAGYLNIRAHAMEHYKYVQMAQQAQAQAEQQQNSQQENNKKPDNGQRPTPEGAN